jgi:membrane protease YdiL (CAAX protease family)
MQPVAPLGPRLLLLLVAALVSRYYQWPGYWLTDRLATVDVVFELATEATPQPRLPADVPGLRTVDCQVSLRRQMPPEVYQGWAQRAPQAGIHTCRFGFALSQAQLFATGLDLFTLLPAALGAAAPVPLPDRPVGLAAWRTEEVVFGQRSLWRHLPWIITLLLVPPLCARATGFRVRADWQRTRDLLIRHDPDCPAWCRPRLVLSVSLGVVFAAFLANILLRQGGMPPSPDRWLPPDFSFGMELLSAVVAAPVVEELVYRAWMIPFLARGMSPHLAIVLSAALFSYAHGNHYLSHWIFGVTYGYLWHYTRSLTLCVAGHALHNLSATSLRHFFPA